MHTSKRIGHILTALILAMMLLPWGSGSLSRIARAACPVTAENWHEVGADSACAGGISNNSGNSMDPSLAIAPDGTPYVAWWNRIGGGGDYEIYVRRWNGSSWAEVGTGSASGGGISNNGGYSEFPSLAIAPDGTPYVAWDNGDGAYYEIYVRRWNGSSWAEVGTGSASGGGISNNGGSWEPSLAIAPDGTPYVAWHHIVNFSPQIWEIYVKRWNGSTWAEVGTGSASGGGISNNGGTSRAPSIAVAPDGTPYIAWHDSSDGDYEIYVRRWNGSSWVEVGTGSASGGGISNNSGGSGYPSVAVAPDGTPYVAWHDSSDGDWEIYVKQWNGSNWVEIGIGSATGGGISDNGLDSNYPSLAIASDGTPYVAWHDSSVVWHPEIYVRRWNGNSWEEAGAGSATGGGISDSGSSVLPSVAIAPDGTPYVAWYDDSSGNAEIYVRRWEGGAPTELITKVQDVATSTNTHLDQVLAEANEIAQDGDYFAVQKTEHEIDLIADAIIDSAGILADGFDTVNKVKDLTKMEFPGVIGRGWGHILDLKAGHEAARDAFRDALQQEVTGSNARRAAKELFNGAHVYYAADMLDTGAEDLLGDGMVKYGWKVGLQSGLALESRLYEAQEDLVNVYKQDVTNTRDETIANMPSLTPAQQDAYIEDLIQRDKANLVMINTLERRALPLHLARDDRESGGGNWIADFLAKYLIKGLAFLYADGPGVLAVDIGSAYWNLYQNSRRLNGDIQMMNLAVEGMGGSLEAEKRIYLNAVHGMDNIVQGIEPKIAQGNISSITNKSAGEYKLFGHWFWCERSSYSEVNVSNSTSYGAVYQVIADYGKTGFLGTSYQPLVSEAARAVPGGGSDTIRVYYKQDDEEVSPDGSSTIEMDLLGSTDTGTYHVIHDGTIWQNPTRVTVSVGAQFTLQDQADAPTIPYPIRSRIAVDEDALTYTPYIWVDNPFTQTVAITLTQPLPADVQIIDANGGTAVGNSLRWQRTINPDHTVEITHLVRYLGGAGQTVDYPEPMLEMANLEATAYVTFTGEAETFVSQPHLSAVGTPPAEIVQGETVTIPITVTNRLTDEAASGTVRLSLVDFTAETEVCSDTQDVSVPAGGSQVVELQLDTANVSEGDYLLVAMVESNGGQEEVFAEYLRVKQSGLYLPIILKSY